MKAKLPKLKVLLKPGLIILITLIFCLPLYDLSMGPIFRLYRSGRISYSFFLSVYAPVFRLEEKCPKLRRFNERFVSYWYDDAMGPHPHLLDGPAKRGEP